MSHLYNDTLWDYGFHAEFCDNNFWREPKAHSHFHRVYEIYYFVENEVIYFIDEKPYPIKPGTVVVVPPDVTHSTFLVNEYDRKRYLIYLSENFIEDLLKDDRDLLKKLSAKPFSVSPNEKQVEKLFENLLNEYQKKDTNIAMQKMKLFEILVALGRNLDNVNENESILELSDVKSETINLIVKYINDHYSEKITLEMLSKKFFLNPSYISRIFKRKLNITFSLFLKNVRINKVLEFLKVSDYSITEIARRTGFDSSTSLCRMFKQSIGMSPLKYRNMYKLNTEQRKNKEK